MVIGEMGSRESEPNKADKLIFNPDRDIPQEAWEEMDYNLEQRRGAASKFYGGISWQASKMKILDPSRDIDINAKERKGMKNNIEAQSQAGQWLAFANHIIEMKVLCSDKDVKITKADWEGMRASLERSRKENDWDFAKLAAAMKILNPNEDLKLDEATWQRMRDKLEEGRRMHNWQGFFSEQAVAMKILNPDEDLKLDQATCQDMRNELERMQKDRSGNGYATRAVEMKILAAEKVEAKDRRLEITMPEKAEK